MSKTIKQIEAEPNSLYKNMRLKKAKGTSNTKAKSTVSKAAYKNMKEEFKK